MALRAEGPQRWVLEGTWEGGRRGRQWSQRQPLGIRIQRPPCPFRPEVQDLDGTSQCPGLAGGKPEDAEEEEEEDELEEEDEDSVAGKSQDDAVSPTPDPQGAYEDEEDEEPPAALAVGFGHTRRWAPASTGHA